MELYPAVIAIYGRVNEGFERGAQRIANALALKKGNSLCSEKVNLMIRYHPSFHSTLKSVLFVVNCLPWLMCKEEYLDFSRTLLSIIYQVRFEHIRSIFILRRG